MKTLKQRIEEEKQHFMKCECGEYFDMRDLQQVFEHLHGSKPPKAEYSYSVEVGIPIAYTKNGKKLDLS